MKVADIMTSPAITVDAGASVASLLELLQEKGITGVPVTGAGGQLVGIVSRQDIVMQELRATKGSPSPNPSLDQILNGGFVTVGGEGLRSQSTPVRDIMTPADKVTSCAPETPLADACALMVAHRVHRLPVLADGTLVGIVTATDVVRAVARRAPGQQTDAGSGGGDRRG